MSKINNIVKKIGERFLNIKESAKISILSLVILFCLGLTYYCHFRLGIEVVFTHIFYIPIVFASFWWGKRGIWVAIFLGVWLEISHLLSKISAPGIQDHLRFGMFIVINMVVGILREHNLQIEKNLRETSDYLSNLIRYANAPILVWNVEGKITLFNNAFERITGYNNNEITNRPLLSFFDIENKEDIQKKINSTFNGENWNSLEIPILHKNGSIRIVLWNSANIYTEDKTTLLSIIAQGQDITEQRNAQAAFKLANAELNQIFETAADGMRVIDKDFNVLRINETLSILTGICKDDGVGKKCYEMIRSPLCHTPNCTLNMVIQSGKSIESEVIQTRNDGSKFPCILTATPFRKPDGELIGIVEDLKDITKRKEVEEELKKYRDHLEDVVETRTDALKKANKQLEREITERKTIENDLRETRDYLEKLINYANAPIIVWDTEFRISRFNHAVERLTNYKASEIIGQKLHIIFPKTSREESLNKIARTLNGEYWDSVEIPILRKDGNIRIVLWNSANIHDEDDTTILATIAQGQDITERKQVEDKIMASLEEKEVLLKEIHHRVKNNLQVISSLLNLQLGYIKNKQAFNMFKESQNRVLSMALIHEKLYQSKDLSRIDFAEYIQSLSATLFRSYGVNINTIALKIDVSNILLGVDTAIPCGLIINELVSNSLKHAFQEGEKGEIRVNLHLDDTNKLTLTVSDNGAGLPEDLDFRNTETLGLKLITTLVKQLNGTIKLNRTGKTEFKIIFRPLEIKGG